MKEHEKTTVKSHWKNTDIEMKLLKNKDNIFEDNMLIGTCVLKSILVTNTHSYNFFLKNHFT